MHNFVVTKQLRPHMQRLWTECLGREWTKYCRTMAECWDHDAEARLSAGCMEARLTTLFSNMRNETVVKKSMAELGDGVWVQPMQGSILPISSAAGSSSLMDNQYRNTP